MADFCKQCSEMLFGKDFGDLKGLSTEEDTKNELFPLVICEGCGFIQVDHEGRCISTNCLEQHNRKWDHNLTLKKYGSANSSTGK